MNNTLTLEESMNNSLTLPALDNQLSKLELELQELQSQIKEKRAIKKAIAQKKQTAVKLLAKLETALMQVTSTFEELGEAAGEVKAIAESKIKNYFNIPQQIEPEPEVKLVETKSNDYFQWQSTSNPHIGSFFDVQKGKTHCTYVGSNNKTVIKSVVANVSKIFPVSTDTSRDKVRLGFKHEVKIWGLDDNAIGWLSGFDFSKSFPTQFKNQLKSVEIAPEQKLTPENPFAFSGAKITHNLYPITYTLVNFDSFGDAIAKDSNTQQFVIRWADWHLEADFYQECRVIFDLIEKSPTEDNVLTLKNSSQFDPNIFEAVINLIDLKVTTPKEIDFSNIIAETDNLMKQLNWTKEKGKAYLLETYSKPGRVKLTDNELFEFRDYLRQKVNELKDSLVLTSIKG